MRLSDVGRSLKLPSTTLHYLLDMVSIHLVLVQYCQEVPMDIHIHYISMPAYLAVTLCIIASTTVAAPSGSLQLELCSLLPILTKTFHRY